MSRYEAQYGYPNADLSVFTGTVHILPPKEDGPTDEDGIPVHTHDYSLSRSTIEEYSDLIEDDELRSRVESADEIDTDLLKDVAEHFAHEQKQVPCNHCGKLIWHRQPDDSDRDVGVWAGYYARHKCKDCDRTCSECGSNLDETKKLVDRRASAKIGNKYKCTECGHTWRGIATG